MAFKASFKFSDSREFDVLNWRVKFNRDVDHKDETNQPDTFCPSGDGWNHVCCWHGI